MPIYEYSCKACKLNFEELVYGDEKPACPACGSNKTGKLISRPSVHVNAARGSYSGEASSSGGGKCAGCSGGNCATCG